MSNSTAENSGDIMRPLRELYLKDLVAREELLQDFCLKVEAESDDAADREEMRVLAHKLSGTGATYGFPRISETAALLEELLLIEIPVPKHLMLSDAHDLLEACYQAHEIEPVGFTAAPVSAPKKVSEPQPVSSQKLPKVLIVDDDSSARAVLGGLIQGSAVVVMSENAQEALDCIGREHPDLVLLDDNMPGAISGMRLLETIKADPLLGTTPIIMITASDQPASVMRGLAAGAVDYILKPFDPKLVSAKIKTRLTRLGKTILIVDDDKAIRELLSRKFSSVGYACTTAGDGPQALEMLNNSAPDLVILDRMLPGLDGMTVLQRMREMPEFSATPVIMLTAKRQESDIVSGLEMGASDYVVKPFNLDEMVARCTRLLGLPKSAAA